jgi:hypothetical protein
MGLNTDFNQSPYFDDFDEAKNFHRVLFKPAVAVQARELTQLQTILQNQIERFGDNILTEGTIIQGGNFVEERKLPYAKVLDIAKNTSGAEVSTDVNQYVGMKAVGQQTGVEAIIIATEYGLESQSPNLSTLFLKYTKGNVVANTNVKTFAAGEEIQLKAADASGDYVTDFHLVTIAPTTVDTNPIGTGYGVRCGEGIIYQKGHFIRFENALTIVSKYSSAPDGLVVGFETIESIVDSNEDSSLLDNANGFNNFNAPGADRLQLTPSLVVKTIAEAKADETFFAIQEYANGKVVRRRLQTQYSTIEKEMERRTAEESGDYVVSKFKIRSDRDPVTPTNINAYISAGLAYVDGQRVELINEIKLPIDEANTFSTVENQDINTNYGMYVNVTSYTGRFDFTTFEQVNLKNTGGTTIGTARVRSVTKESASAYRLYIFAVKMGSGYSFKDTRTITSALGSATVTLVGGNAVLVDASFNKLFFPIGKSFIKSVDETETSFIYRTSTDITITTNTFSFSTADIFPYASGALPSDDLLDFIISAKAAAGVVVANAEILEISSATLDSNLNTITVNLVKNPATSLPVSIYYNAQRTPVAFDDKLLRTVYVKVQANTNTSGVTGNYSLGLPDVYSIEGVWRGTSATAWATLETNATDGSATNNVSTQFDLLTNQYDDYYGLSRIRKKKTFTVGANDKLIVKAKVFKKGDSVGHFFAVDSYPVDDASTVLPANAIRTESIPSYTAADGNKYYLRDVIDLRPYASNTAAYSETASSATINPVITETFANLEFPAPRQKINTKYSYYLSRKDLLVIDQNGDFELIKGVPAENSSYPPEPTKGMLLARLDVPPFPTLDTNSANRIGKPEYGVSIESNQTRRYTMKDIGGIDKRISNLEYYTSLSLLENKAKDFLVTDSSGADRFKNGIFVDNFKNLFLADVNGGEFAAAIDTTLDNITPKIRQYNLGLKYSTGTNVTKFANKAVTLNKTDYVLDSASQPYATALKNCTTSFYNYVGKMQINPTYDTGPDTVRAPAINFETDLATPFIEFTEALSEVVPLTTTQRTQLTRRVTEITTTELEVGTGEATTQNLGDFVTDVNFLPYMRSRQIQIRVVGLRPNTRFFFFFDGVDVNNHVVNGADADAEQLADGIIVARTQAFNGSPRVILSDSDGVLRAVFKIPANTFFVGDRKLEILDVTDIADKDAATSYSSTNYSAFNFAVTKTNLSTTTIPPQFDLDTTITTESRGRGSDPLAQTFIIDPDASSDTNVFITKLDLYFAKKSRAGKGVGIQIREVQNGFPTGPALPFASVYLKASQVNAGTVTPASNALTATTITFEAPVALRTNTEYAVVIAPDGNDPDYLVWISRTGERDVDTNVAVVADTNAGVLFTSTNARTWTPYQNENLKFTLYAARFSAASGDVTLTNDNHEFFTISNLTGTFADSEEVFIEKGSYLTGTVTLVEGNNIVTGSATTFTSDYSVNSHIVTYNGSSYQTLKIKTINSDTQMTLFEPSRYSVSALAEHYTSPVGKLIYFNANAPAKMILEGSTAKAGFIFAAANTLRGETSGATVTVTSVDDLNISYMQPMISRANFSKTRTTLAADKLYNGTATAARDLSFNATNYLTNDSYVIQSRSNNTGTASFTLTVDMLNTSTTTKDTSPLINLEASTVMIGEYMVNNTATDADERIGLGDADAKYVSRMIQLADGMDAEDIRILLGAYKPTSTDIRVYTKFLSSTDPRNFKEVEWTRMYIKPETDSTSSSVNREDYREFEYQLGTTTLGNGLGAYMNGDTINYKDPDGALYTNYKYFAVKIVLLANSYSLVPRLKDLRVLALS